MTANDYKAAGFNLSTLINQSEIDRAEKAVEAAYIAPFFTVEPTYTLEPYRFAVMQLVFIFVCVSKNFATRTGGVVKNSEYSNKQIDLTVEYNLAKYHLAKVRDLATNPHGKQSDILNLYIKTKFFTI